MDRRATFDLLRIQPYRLFFTARTTSALSEAMLPVALAVALLRSGHGTSGIGYSMAVLVFMFIVFVMVGGVLADRFGPRRWMVGADLARLVVQGTTAVVVGAMPHPPLAFFLVAAFVTGIATGLFQPGLGSLIPTIVPGRVQEAAGLLSSATALVTVVAAGAAGGLVALGGPQLVFAIDAAAFGISALCLIRLELPAAERAAGPLRWRADMAEGWREFRARTWFWSVIAVFAFLGLAGFGPFGVLSTGALTERHGSGVFGLLLAAQGVGSMLGGLTAVRIRPRFPLRTAFLVSILTAVPMAAVAFDVPVPLIGAMMLVGGWARSVQFILWNTTEQTHIPGPILNRLFAYDVSGCLALLAAGQALAGPGAGLLGERTAMLGCAVVTVVGCAVILAVPAVRRLPARPEEPAGEPAGSGTPATAPAAAAAAEPERRAVCAELLA